MGALTDNRKRSIDLSPSTPPPKKLKRKHKLTSSQPIRLRTAPIQRFPPVEPLRRPVHGPQRTLKVFRLGSASLPRKRPERMGNFESFGKERSGSGSRSESDGPVNGLGLEDFRRLVVEAEEEEEEEEEARPPVVELPPPRDVVRSPVLEIEESEIAKIEENRVPLYKELYEGSLKRSYSKLNNLEFELKFIVKKVLGFRLADEVLRKEPEEDLHQPFAPLTDEDEVDVHNAMKGSRHRELLVVHEASNIEITREVLQCLRGGAWLNDEVINLYLELLKEREKREPKRFLKCHFFNTFFYKKLISGGRGYDFKAVKRWTTQKKLGYGLIDCEKIFVPIHKQVHWCLAIINIKDKKFQYLDSLGGMDKLVLRSLARYFIDEVKDKSGKDIDLTSWKQETIGNLPLQENGYDCGMFMLKYADFYSRGLNLTFGQDHMRYFRKRTAKEILRLRAE